MNQNTIICTNCKTPNPSQNLYCLSCGRPLIPAAPPPVDPKQPAQVGPVYTPPPSQQPSGYPPPQMPPAAGPAYPSKMPGQMPPPGYGAPQGYQQNVPPPQQGFQGNMPPQGGYYQAPPMPPRMMTGAKLANLGARVDGWADVIPGMAEKAEEMEKAFVEKLDVRKLGGSKLGRIDFATGMLHKAYQVYNTSSGAVVVSFSALGKDLQVSWDLYIRQKPRWMTILIMVGIAFGLSFLKGLTLGFGFGYFLLNWIFGTIDQLFLVIVGGLIAGKILFGSIWSFFIEKPDEAAQQDLTGMAISVHQVIKQVLGEAGVDLAEVRAKHGFKAADQEKKV